jgi:hypothetical protein
MNINQEAVEAIQGELRANKEKMESSIKSIRP